MLAAVDSVAGENFCHACFSGEYPIGFPKDEIRQPELFDGGNQE